MDIETEKKRLREMMREKLRAQSPLERKNKSTQIAIKLRKDSGFLNAKTILFYMNNTEEVETREIIESSLLRKVIVALPRTNSAASEIVPHLVRDLSNLKAGSYGILEPENNQETILKADKIDLVIVPGLAFDESRYRLGRGKGYYDRFLAKLPRHVKTFALAYDFQIVKSLPVTELDFPVTRVFHN